jgi:M-phase inducer tyrosine phosphatase
LRRPSDLHPHKKQKRYPRFDFDFYEMPFFAPSTTNTQYLSAPPAAPSCKRSQPFPRPRDDVDEFLSSDLELSFASTMSLHSPPHRTSVLTPDNERADLMDISPPPNPTFTLEASQQKDDITSKTKNRPRAFTSGARVFGRDMSNGVSPVPHLPSMPKSSDSQSSSNRMQRSALPFEWLATAPSSNVPEDTNLFVKVCFIRGRPLNFDSN